MIIGFLGQIAQVFPGRFTTMRHEHVAQSLKLGNSWARPVTEFKGHCGQEPSEKESDTQGAIRLASLPFKNKDSTYP